MKLTQQFRTIPTHWDESPKNDGEEFIISEDITFKRTIDYVESWCKKIKYFHHYTLHIGKNTLKQPVRIIFTIYIQDPNRKLEGENKVIIVGHENEIPPCIYCIFTLYNNDEHPFYCGYGEFNISKI